jgi:hypothetical protein
VRSAERAREVFSEIGIDVEAALRTGSLSIIGGVDVTNAATLSPNPELWEGVSQAAVSLGPVFARLPGGGMGYLDGMTSEAVDVRSRALSLFLRENYGEREREREREREGKARRERERETRGERGRERKR